MIAAAIYWAGFVPSKNYLTATTIMIGFFMVAPIVVIIGVIDFTEGIEPDIGHRQTSVERSVILISPQCCRKLDTVESLRTNGSAKINSCGIIHGHH